MGREMLTIICLTAITGLVVYLAPDYSKDIALTVTGGLIGYLSREQKQDQTNEKS